jgi:calcium permeable stress-gated cation channel
MSATATMVTEEFILKVATTAAATAAKAILTNTDSDGNNRTRDPRWTDQTRDQRDLITQLIISVLLGLSAFLAFCVCFSFLFSFFS